MRLLGRVALLTSGTRIGAEVALALADQGADLALAYHRSQAETEATAAMVRDRGRRALVVQADLRQPAACTALVERTASALGRLDILVNLASVYEATPLADLTLEALERGLAVDLKAAYLCSMAALPHMRAAGGGRIVNVSDWLAWSHRPRYKGYLPYYVAKAAVIALTEALALEVADQGILVNAIAPGPVLAPDGLPAEAREAAARATPVGRWGGGAAVARAVVALVESNFITGETIRVDGGRHLR